MGRFKGSMKAWVFVLAAAISGAVAAMAQQEILHPDTAKWVVVCVNAVAASVVGATAYEDRNRKAKEGAPPPAVSAAGAERVKAE